MYVVLLIRAMRVRTPHCELKWEMSNKEKEEGMCVFFVNSTEIQSMGMVSGI